MTFIPIPRQTSMTTPPEEVLQRGHDNSESGQTPLEAWNESSLALLNEDPNDRLSLMQSEWNFSDHDLEQVDQVLNAFLNEEARQQINRLVVSCVDQEDDHDMVISQWATERNFERLTGLLDTTQVSDKLLVIYHITM